MNGLTSSSVSSQNTFEGPTIFNNGLTVAIGNLPIGSTNILTTLNNKQDILYNGSGGVDLLSSNKTTIKNLAVSTPLTISTNGTQSCTIGLDQSNIQTKLTVPTTGGSSLLSSNTLKNIVATAPIILTNKTDNITVGLDKANAIYSLIDEVKAPLALTYTLLTSGLAFGNKLSLDTSNIAPLASPTFTGTLTAPTINATSGFQVNGVATQLKPFVSGRVNSAGSILNSSGYNAFTVVHTVGTGIYRINFTTNTHPNVANFGVLATARTVGSASPYTPMFVSHNNASSSYFILHTYDHTGTLTDTDVSFQTVP